MEESRRDKIEFLAGAGEVIELKTLLEKEFTQLEIDVALENAIAYSRIKVADYLMSLGANLSYEEFQGTYYSVHNNEIKGLKYAIQNGVNININEGQLLNSSIVTAYNEKDPSILIWLLDNGADDSLLSKKILDTFGNKMIKDILDNEN